MKKENLLQIITLSEQVDEAVATGIDILHFLGQENSIFIREFWKGLSVATMRVHQINMYICTFKAKQNV